ncbi:ATP-dependent helicase [Gordonia aichiensis]|uniref:ATP-dependent helicase n=1 Tax=Gordonia aichiensis TaxID=36820 RepID=UPI0032639D3A
MKLDPSQRRVVDAECDERLLVTAGAGQGKTEVVAARLVSLLDGGISASTEVLVLSFSRAAVHAIRSRLADRDLADVNVRTFDSFASELLLDLDEEPTGSYGARIRQAGAALRAAAEAPAAVADLRHLIIDEAQDLVGDRADFVLAILDALPVDAGLTVLGDPLQGIYDFVLDESESSTSSETFFTRLRDGYRLESVSLDHHYRARGTDCLRVLDLGVQLRSETDPSAATQLVETFKASLPSRRGIDDWTFVRSFTGRSAILCQSNAEVLRVSRAMSSQGVRHSVRRPAQHVGAAPWLGKALAPLPGPTAAQSDVEAALAAQVGGTHESVDCRWTLLKSTEGFSRNRYQINLRRVANRVRSGSVPLTLTAPDDASIVVSTIHRAKGLEFDNVFIVKASTDRYEDSWARIRRDYVALTRARDHLEVIELVRSWTSIREFHWLPGRLQERTGRRPKTRACAIEFTQSDVYTGRPTGSGAKSAADIQRVLTDAVPGSSVTAELDVERSDLDFPVYALLLDGEPIGVTNEEFGTAFARLFNVRRGVWPAELADLLLVSVETTAGDPRMTEQAGVGPGGFWLVPRIVGMARPQWDAMEEVR